MEKKKQIKIYPDKNILLVEGVKYRLKSSKFKKVDGVEHTDYHLWEEVDDEDYNNKLSILKESLRSSVPADRVIEEVIKQIPLKELNRLVNIIEKKKPKITRQDGCLGIKIDGGKHNTAYIEFFE